MTTAVQKRPTRNVPPTSLVRIWSVPLAEGRRRRGADTDSCEGETQGASGARHAPEGTTRARHLYVHLPFCATRCGYCDFVTVVGHGEQHARYIDAVLRELELERALLAPELDSVYLGGGTPTLTAAPAL